MSEVQTAVAERHPTMVTRSERMVRWFMFSVLASLVPLLISYTRGKLAGEPAPAIAATADGGLLLICTTVAAGALGELIPGSRRRGVEKLLTAGGCTLLVMFCSLYYALAKSAVAPDASVVSASSLWLLVAAIIAGMSCQYLSQEEVTDAH